MPFPTSETDEQGRSLPPSCQFLFERTFQEKTRKGELAALPEDLTEFPFEPSFLIGATCNAERRHARVSSF